jgi:hypothetical protein
MGLSISLCRTAEVGAPLCIDLMYIGTVLVFSGSMLVAYPTRG